MKKDLTYYKVGAVLKLYTGETVQYLDTFMAYNVCTSPRAWSIHVNGVDVLPDMRYKVVRKGKITHISAGNFDESQTYWSDDRVQRASRFKKELGPYLPGMEEAKKIETIQERKCI